MFGDAVVRRWREGVAVDGRESARKERDARVPEQVRRAVVW